MMRRLGAGRLAAAAVLLVAVVGGTAAPALAADKDRVSIHVPSSFTAGGSVGAVTLGAAKRTKGCVTVRSQLGVRLAGLAPDQLRAEVAVDGRWHAIGVSGGEGEIATAAVAPGNPVLCNKKSVSVRYRLTFLNGTPSGTATLIGQFSTAAGDVFGRASHTSKVKGAAKATASPSAQPSETTPAEPTVAPTDEPVVQAVPNASAGTAKAASDSGGLGIGGLVMVLGIGMVGMGVALLVMLLRRNRPDDGPGAGAPAMAGAAAVAGTGAAAFAGGPPRPREYRSGGYSGGGAGAPRTGRHAQGTGQPEYGAGWAGSGTDRPAPGGGRHGQGGQPDSAWSGPGASRPFAEPTALFPQVEPSSAPPASTRPSSGPPSGAQPFGPRPSSAPPANDPWSDDPRSNDPGRPRHRAVGPDATQAMPRLPRQPGS
ncbi:hypothetical protein [Plantactinospora sp. KBS50]|uniref:hypothetical protein n=1 Tax=Plantactinospora sp. KBS50 TaxID=2024580 RepID=UPI000BAB1E1F|nr:hypothetical protein [Plantactinospora sp. KBS50]ASW53725.1 hypothetical protein CIK06_05235 [Plantactinospora sp. KBS50]